MLLFLYMISWNEFKKHLLNVSCGILLLGIAGWIGAALCQPESKTEQIYSQGIESYNKEDFSNSYYQFSKVIFTSNLKPLAIYHQGVNAEKLEDYKSAIKQYKLFLLLYPKHVISIKVRYNLAKVLMKTDTPQAKKLFEYILNNFPNSDYAIAGEYYLGLIDLQCVTSLQKGAVCTTLVFQ